jgi:hypothetical protein
MPGLKTHRRVGAIAGAADAFYQAKDKPSANVLFESIGGALGGYVGGSLPDVFEPAVSSWHRDVGHSIVVAGGGVLYARQLLAGWAQQCRNNAIRQTVPTMSFPGSDAFVPIPLSPLTQLGMTLARLFWSLLAGFLNGLSAGYASHLVLDAGTPRGIPLLTGSF